MRLLRYGPGGDQAAPRACLRLTDIARMVRVSPQQVRVLLQEGQVKDSHRKTVRMGPQPKLLPKHVAYLTSPLIL